MVGAICEGNASWAVVGCFVCREQVIDLRDSGVCWDRGGSHDSKVEIGIQTTN